MKLWAHQTRALAQIREAIQSGFRKILVVIPTGGGKGTAAAEVSDLAIQRGGKALFVVHRREIILDQAERLRARGLDVGVILPGHNARPFADVQVASTSTLLNRMDRLPPASIINLDEAHHYVKNSWAELISAYPDVPIIGWSATPSRADGKALDQFETLIEAAKYSELIREGLIVKAHVYQPSAHMGSDLATDPVAAYQQYAPGTKGFCFVATLDLAREVTRRFCDAGVPAVAVEGKTSKRVRDRAVADLRSGAVRMIVNFNTMGEGVDCPDAQTCILGRACGHPGTYLQCVGRVLRSHPGKRFAILLDLVGASLVHGLPHIDRVYSLDGKAFDSSALPPLKVCEKCGYTQLAGRGTCEGCGWTFLKAERKQPKIYSEALQAAYAWEDTPLPDKLEEFLRLISESEQRGYGVDWVIKVYSELFFCRPPAEWLAELPEARKRAEYDRWAAFGRERGFKRGYPYARYLETFGCQPSKGWAA